METHVLIKKVKFLLSLHLDRSTPMLRTRCRTGLGFRLDRIVGVREGVLGGTDRVGE